MIKIYIELLVINDFTSFRQKQEDVKFLIKNIYWLNVTVTDKKKQKIIDGQLFLWQKLFYDKLFLFPSGIQIYRNIRYSYYIDKEESIQRKKLLTLYSKSPK